MLGAMVWPLIPWVLQLVLFGYWGASAVFLASMGKKQGSLITVNETRNVDGLLVQSAVQAATDVVPCDPGVSHGVDDCSKSTVKIWLCFICIRKWILGPYF